MDTLKMLMFSVLFGLITSSSYAHEIYTGVHGKDGQLCCGGGDCAPTEYRQKEGKYFFLTREKEWIEIPEQRITFLPIPGDANEEGDFNGHLAHLCYRSAVESDKHVAPANVFGSIFLYCAFIPPGGV